MIKLLLRAQLLPTIEISELCLPIRKIRSYFQNSKDKRHRPVADFFEERYYESCIPSGCSCCWYWYCHSRRCCEVRSVCRKSYYQNGEDAFLLQTYLARSWCGSTSSVAEVNNKNKRKGVDRAQSVVVGGEARMFMRLL
jgi:hypothetical protein